MALELKKKDNMQVKIQDVVLNCKAPTAQVMTIAKLKMQKELNKIVTKYKEEKEFGVKQQLNLDDVDILAGLSHTLFVNELAKYVVESWEGVLIESKPAELTEENIELLFSDFIIQDGFLKQYDQPLKLVEEEKK